MILDGFGLNDKTEGNAVAQAKKPNIDALMREYPFVKGNASGLAVGLPDGQMGNSEVVSDFGIAGQERMTAEALTGLLEQHVKEVAAFLTNLREAADEEETLRNDGILQEDETVLERLFAALHCSQTMRASARQYITYAALTGYDWKAELEEWYARGLLPCKDRREGKVRLEELKQVLL